LPTLAYATGDTPIQTVEIAPLFYERFACTEHVNGELSDLGDALGSDCLVLGGMGASKGMMRFYRTNGANNEDWYSWHVEVHAPFDGVVIEIGINSITNTPGNAHLDDIRVHQGDHVGVGQVVALDGDNGTAKNPHVHVGAYRGKKPLQIRWDLAAEGRIQTLAHPQQQPHP
jgi:lysophospholipase L1-like esterase